MIADVGDADRFGLAGLHPNSTELAAARAFRRRQIELHEKSAAGGVCHRCYLDDRPLNRRSALGNLHEKFGADFDVADERFGHVGLEAERSRIFHFDDGFSGCSEIADISEFARDDSIKRRNDLRVAEHRLHLSCRSFGDPRPRLHGVEIRLRRDFFVEQFATAGEVARRLLAQGERLIELGLNLARIELCDQIPGLHHLSRGDEQRLDPGTYFWFDRGAEFCPHRADDFLARWTRLAFDHDGADRDRRQRL